MKGRPFDMAVLIAFFARVSFGAYSDDSRRSLQLGPERTSPTLEPKSLLMGGNLSIVRGTGGFDVSHGSET